MSGPWEIDDDGALVQDGGYLAKGEDAEEVDGADPYIWWHKKEDKEFLLRAVNNHESLVGALEETLRYKDALLAGEFDVGSYTIARLVRRMESALAGTAK